MILVTGGAGYIGSHTCIELLIAGYELLILDNLSNASSESIKRIESITGSTLSFVEGDVQDQSLLHHIFTEYKIEGVIHFAGLKAVGESVLQPLRYYQNNVVGSLTLIKVMSEFNCKSLVFSSSATVYGDPPSVPIREDFPLSATNPYGASKLMIETALRDLQLSDPTWSIGVLRYFNPVGAHESGMIGEDPQGIPNNLMPYISKVAAGQLERLSVFGNDYPTPDGTGVRDYIHVTDLAKGHVKAFEYLLNSPQYLILNLGTGRGYSVLEIVHAFEKASGNSVPYIIEPRRPGDVAQCYADTSYAKKVIDWKAELNLDRMCKDAWRWQLLNPDGYKI